MDLKAVTTFLEANKDNDDVKKFVGSFYSAEKLNPIFDSEDGGKVLQPRLDTHFNKSLETWKKNNLTSLIDEEVKKRNPAETDEQKRLRKLEKDIEDERAGRKRADLKNVAVTHFTEKKLPIKLADYFIGSDEDTTKQNIKALETVWDAEINARVDAKFKENGRQKPGEKDSAKTGNTSMNNWIRQAAGIKTN